MQCAGSCAGPSSCRGIPTRASHPPPHPPAAPAASPAGWRCGPQGWGELPGVLHLCWLQYQLALALALLLVEVGRERAAVGELGPCPFRTAACVADWSHLPSRVRGAGAQHCPGPCRGWEEVEGVLGDSRGFWGFAGPLRGWLRHGRGLLFVWLLLGVCGILGEGQGGPLGGPLEPAGPSAASRAAAQPSSRAPSLAPGKHAHLQSSFDAHSARYVLAAGQPCSSSRPM